MSASTASQKINSFDDVVSLKNVKKGSEDAAAVEAAKKTLGVDRDGDDNVFPSINRFNFCVGDRATSLSHRRKDAFLQVLVCTGNLANTEPTRDCLSAWIPKNGRISEVIQDGMTGDNAYCYDDDNNVTLCKDDEDHSALHQSSGGANRDGLFDIIVIGMQEATFFSDEVARISASTFGQLRRATMIYSRYFSICKQRTPERVSNGVVDVEPSVLTGRNGTAVISKMLQDRLPQHNSIMHYKRGEMRMIIFVKKNLVREVSNLDCRAENTGIGSLLPNKVNCS